MKLSETQELTMKMAEAGYESYSAYTGDDLPKWEHLPGGVVNAWFAAADGMTKFLASVGPVEVVDGPREEKINELKHALNCAEISLNGYRNYLHDMAIVEMDGKIYRGVPGVDFGGKWEMLYRHKTGDAWVLVQNYQIKSDLNKKYAGSTGEGETG